MVSGLVVRMLWGHVEHGWLWVRSCLGLVSVQVTLCQVETTQGSENGDLWSPARGKKLVSTMALTPAL